MPHDRRAQPAPADGRRSTAGRADAPTRDEAVELQAWTLLRRYGVVFRRLLTREANAATWRELAQVYRRLEARGEIRGGRFVSGMSGEQFALPDAVDALREVRRLPADGAPGDDQRRRSAEPRRHRHRGRARARGRRRRIVYRDGVPLAVADGDGLRELTPLDPSLATDVARVLKARPAPALALR